jgi:hypothetical protein
MLRREQAFTLTQARIQGIIASDACSFFRALPVTGFYPGVDIDDIEFHVEAIAYLLAVLHPMISDFLQAMMDVDRTHGQVELPAAVEKDMGVYPATISDDVRTTGKRLGQFSQRTLQALQKK